MSWRCTFYGTRYGIVHYNTIHNATLKECRGQAKSKAHTHTHVQTRYAADRSVGLLNRRYSKLVSLLVVMLSAD